MKKIFTFILTAVLALNAAVSSQASPAYPYPIKYTQPDGSVITIQIHGDEFYSWVTDENGNEIKMDDNGFYRKVSNPKTAAQKRAASMSSPLRMQSGRNSVKTSGNQKFLILLIQFQQTEFTSAHNNAEFYNMLNQTGYNTLGAIGSVKEYFQDNSNGKFNPTFDVYGPVTVSGTLAEYGKHSSNRVGGKTYTDNDNSVARALLEACYLLDDQIDFSEYDTDRDGEVDNIFFYFAGYSEAEGGPETSIWPHKWDVFSDLYCGNFWNDTAFIPGTEIAYKNALFDGKSIGTYGCTSEFTGSSGSDICGIGTFCHEFSHTLGLPDYYDTDYKENGQSDGLFGYSLMSSGNYNGDGRIPPYYTTIDKIKLGWISSWTELSSGENYSLSDNEKTKAYRTVLSSKEYFVYEARNGQKWDSPLPTGLLIYHVRESQFDSNGNTYANNPGIYFKASHPSSTNPPSASEKNVPYPGPYKVTTFDNNSPSPATDWNGTWHGDTISDISFSSSQHKVTFTYTKKDTNKKTMTGKVTDYVTGSGISGAAIEVTYSGEKKSATTGSGGSYSIDFGSVASSSFSITISKDGYCTFEDSFTHPGGEYTKNFSIIPTSAAEKGLELKRYSSTTSPKSYGISNTNAIGCVKYSASAMKPFVGMKINEISFQVNGSLKSEKAVVWFGSDLVLEQTVSPVVSNKFVTVTVEGGGLTIPSGKDVYVGYSESGSEFPFAVDENSTDNDGFFAKSSKTDGWSNWCSYGSLLISFSVAAEKKDQMYKLGYSGLNLKSQYSKRQNITPSIVESADPVKSVTYYYDGSKMTGSSINTGSTVGDHTIKAVVTYESGRTETIIQVIKVQ